MPRELEWQVMRCAGELRDDAHQSVWQAIEAAEAAPDVGRRRETIEQAINRALTLWQARPESSDALYALGYALYKHPDRAREPWMQHAVTGALEAALLRAPDHAMARMYLGYGEYDRGNTREALRSFSEVDASRLSDLFALNREEMLVCCAIRLDGLQRSLDALTRYVATAETKTFYDVFPSTLARVIEERVAELATMPRADLERLEALARRLDIAARMTAWFEELVNRQPCANAIGDRT